MVNSFKSGNTQTILALALSTALLSACGGGGGDNGDSTTTTTVSGRAVDGPLAGSTVLFEDCTNKPTVITDADGKFNFPNGCTSSKLTVTGGIDTTSALPFTGTLKAPAVASVSGSNQIVVTPITTLIANAGGDAAAASKIATALGLPVGVDPLKTDPLTNVTLLAKNAAVQQLIEQISLAVANASSGTITVQAAAESTFKVLSTQLTSSTSTTSLSDSNIIKNVVTNASTQAGLNTNVAANLASLTSNTIAKTVQSTESTLSALTPAQASTTDALKLNAQAAIVAAKTDVTTQNLVTTLAPVLNSTPSTIASQLETISTNLASTTPNINAITTAVNQINTSTNSTIDTTDVTTANQFTQDYTLLGSFNLSGSSTAYTPALLNQSLVTPIVTNSLDNLLISLSSSGTYATLGQDVTATLKVESATKSLLINVSKLHLDFNGGLTNAYIPAGATVTVVSANNNGLNGNFTTSQNISTFSNSGLALNSNILAAISPSLKTSFTQFNSEKGTSTITAIIAPVDNHTIAVQNSTSATSIGFAPQYTLSLGNKTYTGYGVKGRFTIQ